MKELKKLINQFKKWLKEGSDPAPNYLLGKARKR